MRINLNTMDDEQYSNLINCLVENGITYLKNGYDLIMSDTEANEKLLSYSEVTGDSSKVYYDDNLRDVMEHLAIEDIDTGIIEYGGEQYTIDTLEENGELCYDFRTIKIV